MRRVTTIRLAGFLAAIAVLTTCEKRVKEQPKEQPQIIEAPTEKPPLEVSLGPVFYEESDYTDTLYYRTTITIKNSSEEVLEDIHFGSTVVREISLGKELTKNFPGRTYEFAMVSGPLKPGEEETKKIRLFTALDGNEFINTYELTYVEVEVVCSAEVFGENRSLGPFPVGTFEIMPETKEGRVKGGTGK
jgi:hypothetical protein